MLKINYAVHRNIQECPMTILENVLFGKIKHENQLL